MPVDNECTFVNDSAVILPIRPYLLAGILNQPIAWYFQFKKFPHKKDEALVMDIAALNQFPIPRNLDADEIEEMVKQLITYTQQIEEANAAVISWLYHQFGISKLSRGLINAIEHGCDDFVAAVQCDLPKRRKLTAAEISELKREHAATIEPNRVVRARLFNLERRLSDVVNRAYGLTQEEVDLMWRTAPPRMPFTPAGSLPSADEGIDEEDANAEE